MSAQHFYTVRRDLGPSKLPEELKPYAEALHGLFKNAAMAAYCLGVPSESDAGGRYVEELKRERAKEHLTQGEVDRGRDASGKAPTP